MLMQSTPSAFVLIRFIDFFTSKSVTLSSDLILLYLRISDKVNIIQRLENCTNIKDIAGEFQQLTGATLPDLLDSVLLAVRRNLWFQHDGVPVHFSVDARAQLTVDYGEHWIRRKGPVAWPARSPDLTFLDFFLWECVKSMVYVTRAATRAHLIDRINAAFDNVKQNPATLDSVGRSLLRLYEACNEAQGRLFEHYCENMSFNTMVFLYNCCIEFRTLWASTFTCA
ncbi:hypothetical protein ANN_03374 [Periplaneta americana]|uniref:Uncharacterized protein n=1 Tax=Periplaneta americana TaxID=6978 RepID=A0ABQ8U0K3_PERAM|nr:hypothetical protein ANN_03374 [Periplaneta americana]